jgi:hypothetical protein
VYIDSLPRETDRERERYWRAGWLFTPLYLGGPRQVAKRTRPPTGRSSRRDHWSLTDDVSCGTKTSLEPTSITGVFLFASKPE